MSSESDAQVRAVRSGSGLVEMQSRGLIGVEGADRARWLNGMVSNDVEALHDGSAGSGCYALLLTPKGRVVADFHVLLRPEGFWLETLESVVPSVLERLERYIIADDVTLREISAEHDQLGLEGPDSTALLEAAAGVGVELGPEACMDLEIGGVPTVVAAFGWTGERAVQLFAPAGRGVEVSAALDRAAGEAGLTRIGPEAQEILRIEAGVPLLGFELDESVLPDEAGLERAISTTKGCYTGQEIVARLRSRGHVNHALVGLRFDAPSSASPEMELFAEGRRTGEVTSVCVSPTEGGIGLGYVRVVHSEPGQQLSVSDGTAIVARFSVTDAHDTEPSR